MMIKYCCSKHIHLRAVGYAVIDNQKKYFYMFELCTCNNIMINVYLWKKCESMLHFVTTCSPERGVSIGWWVRACTLNPDNIYNLCKTITESHMVKHVTYQVYAVHSPPLKWRWGNGTTYLIALLKLKELLYITAVYSKIQFAITIIIIIKLVSTFPQWIWT